MGLLAMSEMVPKSATKCAGNRSMNARFWWSTYRGTNRKINPILFFQCLRIPGWEQAVANTVDLRVLSAIGSAVPVRLMKRDLLSVIERLLFLMDENRVELLARQHGIRQKRDDGGVKRTLIAFVRRADEGTRSRLLVEASILLAASRSNPTALVKEAATIYKVDTDAITNKVRQEFAAKKKARKTTQPATKTAKKAA